MTTNFSLNSSSPTSNCNYTLAIGASNCPLRTIFWNSGGGPSFNNVYRASYRVLRKSAFGMAPDKALVSMSPPIFNSPTSLGKHSILSLFFNGNFVDSGRNLVSPSGVTWSCGKKLLVNDCSLPLFNLWSRLKIQQ